MSKDDRELIATLRGLLAKATPLPWVPNHEQPGAYARIETEAHGYFNDGWVIASELLGPDADDNIALIAKGINALPALLDRLEALQAQPVGEESGWLIEMVEPDHNKSPVPRWWHPEHGWTWDANKALRFAREIDAQDYILGSGRLPGKPTEHMFLDSAGGEA